MDKKIAVYGLGDIKPALESIGATARQLAYLVEKGFVRPSVQMKGRTCYTREDLQLVYFMLGPFSMFEVNARKRIAGVVKWTVFGSYRSGEEFITVDLEDVKKNRPSAVRLRIDSDEMKADFADFMALVNGVEDVDVDALVNVDAHMG